MTGKSTQHVIVGTQAHHVIQAVQDVEKALTALERSIEGLIEEQSGIRAEAERILQEQEVEAVLAGQMWSYLGAYDRLTQQLFTRQQNGVERAIELTAHMLTLIRRADDLHTPFSAMAQFVSAHEEENDAD